LILEIKQTLSIVYVHWNGTLSC